MNYYKVIENDYIVAIGVNIGGEEITKEEYDMLLNIIKNRPVAPDGYENRLKTDLNWEQFETLNPTINDWGEINAED